MNKAIFRLAFPGMKVNMNNLSTDPFEYLGEDYLKYLQQLYKSKK